MEWNVRFRSASRRRLADTGMLDSNRESLVQKWALEFLSSSSSVAATLRPSPTPRVHHNCFNPVTTSNRER